MAGKAVAYAASYLPQIHMCRKSSNKKELAAWIIVDSPAIYESQTRPDEALNRLAMS